MRPKRKSIQKQYIDCLKNISEMQEYIHELHENQKKDSTELEYLLDIPFK